MSKFFLSLLALVLCYACTTKKQEVNDFEQIKKSGKLTIITLSSSTSYFIYKDEPMGYYYDLCKDFANYHGLELEVKIASNASQLLQMLKNGEGDLVAYDVPVENRMKDSLIYCGLEQITHQVLVQRIDKDKPKITDVTELIGKEIYVKDETKHHNRLVNLNDELGSGIIIKDVGRDTLTVEDLIEMVSLAEIDYTISDENLARLNKTYFKNIDISMPISFEQRSSWVVRKDSPYLAKALNEWFDANDNTPVYRAIIKKYFELSKQPFEDIGLVTIPKGHLSPYDNLFKKHAKSSHYDWKLLVSIAYQESHFKTDLSSWAGAVGLMGLMPRTAQSLGLSSEDRKDPDLSIKAAVSLLLRLDKLFADIEDKDERIKFILAAYNGGNGHINDARELARKHGANPYKWEGNVRKYLELKSKPEYYNDSVVKNGYFRGTETIRYVDQIIANWERYKEKNK